MKGKLLTTIGLVLLSIFGLAGVFFRVELGAFAFLVKAIGVIGFPILYGYITWPVGKQLPDREWVGTIGVMALFALIILFR